MGTIAAAFKLGFGMVLGATAGISFIGLVAGFLRGRD